MYVTKHDKTVPFFQELLQQVLWQVARQVHHSYDVIRVTTLSEKSASIKFSPLSCWIFIHCQLKFISLACIPFILVPFYADCFYIFNEKCHSKNESFYEWARLLFASSGGVISRLVDRALPRIPRGKWRTRNLTIDGAKFNNRWPAVCIEKINFPRFLTGARCCWRADRVQADLQLGRDRSLLNLQLLKGEITSVNPWFY